MARSFLIVLLAPLLTSCATKLFVRHEDPAVPYAQVRVDGESRGFVAVGDTLKLTVDRGFHLVEAVPRGESENPWSESGEGWTVYIDRRATVTLLPRN